jgi:hypothetical protein
MPFIATTAAEQAQLAFFNYAKEQSKKSNERMSVVSSEIRCGWRVATKKKRNDFTCSVKEFDTNADDYHYFKYDPEYGLGIYARRFIPAGTVLRLKGNIGRPISNTIEDLSQNNSSIFKSIFTVPILRNEVEYKQNYILLGSAAVANYACSNHANIIFDYNKEPKNNWDTIFTIKDIQEDAQLFINYNIDNTTMCSFSGRHRCYYHRTDFEIFDHIITEAQRRKEMQEGRASRAAKRSHSEI